MSFPRKSGGVQLKVADDLARPDLVGARHARPTLALVRPDLAAVAVFTAIQRGNEFLFGRTMTTGPLPRR